MMLSDIFLTRFLTDVVHLNHPETSQRRFAPTPDHFTGISGPLHWNTHERNRRSCAALPHTASTHLFEEAAAFAAVGYAKYTGRIGVCCVMSGSGGVHLLNGLTTRNVTCSQ